MEQKNAEEYRKISSLSEYIELVSSYPNSKYSFRGENAFYSERVSNALRPYDGSWKSKKEFPFVTMIQKYYSEISHRISDVEKNSFIAFAQHYGIPTNLIDITSSPLTALYFACLNQEIEDGFIYIFDDANIDITDIFELCSYNNFFEMLFTDTKVLLKFARIMQEYKCHYPKHMNDHKTKLIEDMKHCFKHDAEVMNCFKNNSDNEDCLFRLYEFARENYPIIAIDDAFTAKDIELDIIAFITLMSVFINKMKANGEPFYWINFLPNMIYKPTTQFDRSRAQKGYFLVQPYIAYLEPVYDYYVLAKQRVRYSSCFRVQNKEAILKQLDDLGVNAMTIFQDFDNVAKYIFDKYK